MNQILLLKYKKENNKSDTEIQNKELNTNSNNYIIAEKIFSYPK